LLAIILKQHPVRKLTQTLEMHVDGMIAVIVDDMISAHADPGGCSQSARGKQ